MLAAVSYFFYVASTERGRLCEIIESYQLDGALPASPKNEIDAICADIAA